MKIRNLVIQILLVLITFSSLQGAVSTDKISVQQNSFYTLKIIIENVYDSSFLYQINIMGSDGTDIKNTFSSTNSFFIFQLKYDVDYYISISSKYHFPYKFKIMNENKEKYIEKKINLIELRNPDQIRHQDTDYIYFGED